MRMKISGEAWIKGDKSYLTLCEFWTWEDMDTNVCNSCNTLFYSKPISTYIQLIIFTEILQWKMGEIKTRKYAVTLASNSWRDTGMSAFLYRFLLMKYAPSTPPNSADSLPFTTVRSSQFCVRKSNYALGNWPNLTSFL